jgi:hypothetical protein
VGSRLWLSLFVLGQSRVIAPTMTTHNQKSDFELEIDAKDEVERFRRYHPTFSTEEILLRMAKSYVYLRKNTTSKKTSF